MIKWSSFFDLIRVNKPIGFFLLLWKTLWALWLCDQHTPSVSVLIVFIMGVFLMRSLGCVVNDCIDKDIDGYVKRTRHRPLSCGIISLLEAIILVCILVFFLFILVLIMNFNTQTMLLSLIALVLTCLYPYTKRCLLFPQFFLGVTFGCSTFIVFSALGASLFNILPWTLFLINIIWTVMYDTEYAMVDCDDDQYFGIRSSAIFLKNYEKMFIGILQLIILFLFIFIGWIVSLGVIFYLTLVGLAMLFVWQQVLIMDRDRVKCFQAFLNNNYVGMLVFFGIVLDLSISSNI